MPLVIDAKGRSKRIVLVEHTLATLVQPFSMSLVQRRGRVSDCGHGSSGRAPKMLITYIPQLGIEHGQLLP